MKTILLVIAAVATILGLIISASATPFTNGSFEDYNESILSDGWSWIRITGYSKDYITGWETGVTDTDTDIDYIGPSLWKAADQDYSIDLGGAGYGGSISQTFSTDPGTTYLVQFAMSGNPAGGPEIKKLQASAGDFSQQYEFKTTFVVYGSEDWYEASQNMGWTDMTFYFTATETETTLTFTDKTQLSEGGYAAAIDNVRVSVAPVPEPATMFLLGSGLIGVGIFARRKFKR